MIDSNYKNIRKVLIIILFLNLGVSLTKIILGTTSNSSSIYADGLHSLSDGFNNVVGVIALAYAYKPADKNHPYGHKKFETILSMFIGFVLIMLAFTLFKDNILNFNKSDNLDIDTLSIGIMVGTMLINIFVTRYELSMGKKLNSSFLISDAKHTMSDVYVSLSVLVSLIGIKYFNLPTYFDNIMSLLVAIIILRAAISILLDATKVLSDKIVIDPKIVEDIVLSFPEVESCHMIKSRGFEDDAFLELHILVDPNMSVKSAHTLNHDIEKKIKEKIMQKVDVIIHIEPSDHKH